jgi:hypothetical protein
MSRRAWASALSLAALVGSAAPAAQIDSAEPAAQIDSFPDDPRVLLDRVQAAWEARDPEAWAALWDESRRDEERAFAREQFAGDESRLTLFRPRLALDRHEPFQLRGDVFEVREPHGRVAQWLLDAAKQPDGGWRLVARNPVGSIDGLVHLELDPAGFRAAGLRIELEDFELQMQQGTLFMSPESVGRTALVFVGRGEVRFRPRPETEQDQLARFAGDRELVERVGRAFVRIHPGDLERLLSPHPLVPDPDSARRLGDAMRYYQAHVERFFTLDAAAPRSPWWLLPSRGDAVVIFDTRRRGELTYSLSRSEPEAVSLFDREKRRQICLYPAAGGSTRYDEDAGRAADVLHREVTLRLDPDRRHFQVTARLRIRALAVGAVLRVRLDDAFQVQSVSTPRVGRLLFFRVRGQNAVMVSLGSLGGVMGSFDLTLRYAGEMEPTPIRDEVLQIFDRGSLQIPIEETLVYTKERAWYPWLAGDDHATSKLRVDLPADYVALSGGHRTEHPSEPGRRVTEFELEQPGRYLTLAVGRFEAVGSAEGGGVTLEGYASGRLRDEVRGELEASRGILDFYAGEFGPAPYPELLLAGVEGEVPGGHGPPGMVLLSHRPPFLRLQRLRDDPAHLPGEPHFFLAHELAHQWWGHGVAGQNYRERWISEAFAHYAAALWVRHARGEELFQRALRQFERWASRHSEYGPIHLGYRVGHIDREPQAFRAVVYDKGAYVLHMLRGLVGPEAFRSALTALQARFRYGKIGSEDVREALEGASGLELAPYFEAWVLGKEIPELHYAWKRVRVGDAHSVEVEVRTRHLPGPVPLTLLIETEAGPERRRVRLPAAGSTFVIELPARARGVELNGDRGLLARVERL